MSAKHTPGPWTIRKSLSGSGLLIIHSPQDSGLAATRREQDATLIAAAPELLEALKTTAGNIRSLHSSTGGELYAAYTEWLKTVEAAIKKAEEPL